MLVLIIIFAHHAFVFFISEILFHIKYGDIAIWGRSFLVPTSNLVQICLIVTELWPLIDFSNGSRRHLKFYFLSNITARLHEGRQT